MFMQNAITLHQILIIKQWGPKQGSLAVISSYVLIMPVIISLFATCIDDFNCLLRLQSHGAIYRPYSFVLMLRYCANLKAMRYESTSLKRIVADKSRV